MYSNYCIANFGRQLAVSVLALALGLVSNNVWAAGIEATIVKSKNSEWTVSYSASKPIKQVAFRRNPNDARTMRWHPKNDDFSVVISNGEEFIVRKDQREFTHVELLLTPTYTVLPKDYAPFSPYSDGGMLIHTGRFFACENLCNDDLNQWNLELRVPEGEHILLDGVLHQSRAVWNDSNSGRNVYVGKQAPKESNGFLALIDPGLPTKIKDSLETDIPKIAAYFESNLGSLGGDIAPVLFASYSNSKGTSVQGGVLPQQIFIHWDKDNLADLVDDQNFLFGTLWTFAHEMGHHFQHFNDFDIEPNESWIHEGHAEMLAYSALTHLYPSADDFRASKIEQFEQDCAHQLQTTALVDAANNGQFGSFYSCGFLIYQALSRYERDGLENGVSPYTIWKLFRTKVGDKDQTATQSFANVVAELTSQDVSSALNRFISNKHLDVGSAIEAIASAQNN